MRGIKCVIFDMDGVLFDGREWHEEAFLRAVKMVAPAIQITSAYHTTHLDGLSTKQKLQHLASKFNLSNTEDHTRISRLKQKYTEELLATHLKPNKQLQQLLQNLKDQNLRILCVSNSIYRTTQIALNRLGLIHYFDGILSNEDAMYPKPAPELYMRAFIREHISPAHVLILEDSHHGRTAAYDSCAHVLPIVDTSDTTLEKVDAALISEASHSRLVNIVVPMAGFGSRFAKAGYADPKPFIPVFGKPMIQWVIENMLPTVETYGHKTLDPIIKPRFHFVAQKQHIEKYTVLTEICTKLNLDYTITTVDKVTEGSACTILLAKNYINTDDPLVSVNSDQWLDWNPNEYYRALLNPTYDGLISVFHQPDPSDLKWSYSAPSSTSPFVTQVAEKEFISPWATTGIYGWARGSDYVKYAEQMIAKNIRINNEFYTCPVYNEAIQSGLKIRNIQCKRLWGLGTPTDLEAFNSDFPKCHHPYLI
jgi:HAD superfamily hydrolase (TIGR01509 family)